MKIYVDADACPVIRIVEQVAEKYGISVMLICDTSHELSSEYSEIKMVGVGTDAVDFVLVNLCTKLDIVVTQDYGVAAIALGKGAYAIHQSGFWYTNYNIDYLLMSRHLNRRKTKIPKRERLKDSRIIMRNDYIGFEESFEKMVVSANRESIADFDC
jgi:hypothetical protein